jgi:hypothetical protein
MAKSKWVWVFVALAFVLGLGWYFPWSAMTPVGQPPLTRLTNDNSFISQFNRAASKVRMVLLLSPT